MAWQPSGEYYSFDEESIKRNAPTISGVYGLYNFNYQIIIGETANIRVALLRHLTQAQQFHEIHRPTGFTFELCDLESRKEKANQLVAQYKPVLQDYRPPSVSVKPLDPGAIVEPAPKPDVQWEAPPRTYPEPALLSGRKKPEPYYFNRNQVAVLTSGFAACLVIVFTLGFFAGKNFQRSVMVGSVPAAVQAPVSAPLMAQDDPEPTMTHEPVIEPITKASPKPVQPAPTVNEKITPISPAKPVATGPQPIEVKPVGPVTLPTPTPAAIDAKNGWAVQLRSSVDRQLTESLVQRLKDKGMEPYVTDGVVNGQTWYRVRLGRFDSQAEAEALRQKMAADSEFRNAFVTK